MSYIPPAVLKESGCTSRQLELLKWILNLEPGALALVTFFAHSDKRTLNSLINRGLVEYVPTRYAISDAGLVWKRPQLTKTGRTVIYRALGCQ